MRSPNDASPMRADFVAAVNEGDGPTYPGVPIFPGMSAGASDSMWFRYHKVPSYGASPVFIKESDDFSHGLNERTPVSNIAPGDHLLPVAVHQPVEIMASRVTRSPRRTPDPDADWSLPGWLYTDPEFLAVEMERVIRPSWQIVCHVSDIADAGRLAHARLYRRERHRGPRRRRRRARLRQCLPPPRDAAGRGAGGLREEARLPLSRLDLRTRRAAERACRCAATIRRST